MKWHINSDATQMWSTLVLGNIFDPVNRCIKWMFDLFSKAIRCDLYNVTVATNKKKKIIKNFKRLSFRSDFDFKPRIGEHFSNCQSNFFTCQFIKRNMCGIASALCDFHVPDLMRVNRNADDWFCKMNRFNNA